MPRNEYITVVFPNGIVIQFRFRDSSYNRIKVCSDFEDKYVRQFGVESLDDCNAEQLADFMRWIDNMVL